MFPLHSVTVAMMGVVRTYKNEPKQSDILLLTLLKWGSSMS
jgi:hypothetical protein